MRKLVKGSTKTFERKGSLRLLAAIGAILAVSGCATNRQVQNLAHSAQQQGHKDLSLAANRGMVVKRYQRPYLVGSVLNVVAPTPVFLSQQIVYHTAISVPLSTVTAFVTSTTGIPIDINALSNSSSVLGVTVGGIYPRVNVNYSGTLSGLLDTLANEAGAFWHFENGRIVFFRTITKTFWLASLPHKSTDTSTVSSISGAGNTGGGMGGSMGGGMGMAGGMAAQGGFGGSGSGTAESSSMGGISGENTYTINPWAGIEKTAKVVAGTAQVAVDPTSGAITVTGTPAQVSRVREWVKNLNDYYGQQIEIVMHIYNVQLSSEDNYGFSPSVIYKAVTGTTGYAITPLSIPSVQGLGSPGAFTLTRQNNATSGQTTEYNGTTAAVSALSTLGKVVQVYSQAQVTTNGHPAVMQTGHSISYLYSVSNLATANVGSSSTLTPGVINTGLTTLILPKIVNGAVHLGVTLTNSSLVSITSASSNGSTIQTPDVDSTSLQQDAILRPGGALLLMSLRGQKGSSTHNGTGSALNPLLGGGFDAQTSKSMIAVVITAKVL